MVNSKEAKSAKGAVDKRSATKQQPLIPIRQNLEIWLKDFNYTLNKAKALREDGFYDVAALYIHLAVEKALKAAIAAFKCQEPPKTHALESLYSKVADSLGFTGEEVNFLKRLTDAAFGTRYFDVSLRLPDEIYTKQIVDEYFEKALPIIDKIVGRIRELEK